MSYAQQDNVRLADPRLQSVGMGSLNDPGARDRFRCIELAVGAGKDVDADSIVRTAGKFYDFITGKTVAERVAKALSNADVG